MSKKQYKVIRAYVTDDFYNEFTLKAKRRFTRAYKSRFTRLGIKILMRIHDDQQLVKELNKLANKRYADKKQYSDRAAMLIFDILKEYVLNNENKDF